MALDTLGTLERNRGNLAEAEAYCVRAIAIDRTLYGDNNHQTSVLKAHLAQVYVKIRQDQQAEPLLREAVGALTARPLPGNLSVGVAQLLLGEVLLRQKHYDEAAKYLAAGYAILLKGPGKSSATRVREARQDLVTVYEALKMPEKASEFRTEPAANEPRKADLASGH